MLHTKPWSCLTPVVVAWRAGAVGFVAGGRRGRLTTAMPRITIVRALLLLIASLTISWKDDNGNAILKYQQAREGIMRIVIGLSNVIMAW